MKYVFFYITVLETKGVRDDAGGTGAIINALHKAGTSLQSLLDEATTFLIMDRSQVDRKGEKQTTTKNSKSYTPMLMQRDVEKCCRNAQIGI